MSSSPSNKGGRGRGGNVEVFRCGIAVQILESSQKPVQGAGT